ncbi:MAG: outer membrane insertion C- signal [Draconibacterium sp.]|nr:MAG: outer membrane insertion C- signal [Draconibacterium sp.]
MSIVAGSVAAGSAQEIGIRFGGTTGSYGAAIDAVFSTGQFNRVHADLGFYSGNIGVDALWNFIYRPLGSEVFNWYLGVGPSLFLGDGFELGASGEIGVEYLFSTVPVAIGLDWRPTLWIIEDTRFGGDSFGLNVRFVFGK